MAASYVDQPPGKLTVCLKLYDCPPVSGGLTLRCSDSVDNYLTFGWQAGAFCHELLQQAENDPLVNQLARERAREMLVCVMKSKLPKNHIEMANQGLVALFLWLVLNDPQDGQARRSNLIRILELSGCAVVTIGCSQNRVYVITMSDINDIARSVTDALFQAEGQG